MKNEPRTFAEAMERLLGPGEATALSDAMGEKPTKSIRWNAMYSASDLPGWTPVPWYPKYGQLLTDDAFPSLTTDYALGRYYIQDAGSMLAIGAATATGELKGARVLDLCAAPGGKTTHAAEYIGDGMVVANEVVGNRLDALRWNVIRHRVNNTLVMSEPPEYFARQLPGYFDILLADVPCSGESLIARGKLDAREWSYRQVLMNVARQRQILTGGLAALKPGGLVVYATCTFSAEENEDQVSWMLENGCEPVSFPNLPVSPAITSDSRVSLCSRRILPHRDKAAGAFVALLRKSYDDSDNAFGRNRTIRAMKEKDLAIVQSIPFITIGEDVYFHERRGEIAVSNQSEYPEPLASRSLQLGLPILKPGKVPDYFHGCVTLADPGSVRNIKAPDVAIFLKGHDLRGEWPAGYCFAGWEGSALGLGKVSVGRMANHFPKAMRNR